MVKIFVTGATGYIGGSVAERLLRDGHAATGLARSADGARAGAAIHPAGDRYPG